MSFASEQSLSAAMASLKANRSQEAEQACRAVLASQPHDPNALHLLGLALLQQQRSGEAVEALSRAAQIAPNSPEIHANLGNALRAQNRFPEASAALERAIKLKPDYPIALSNLGTVRRALGDLPGAAEALMRATRAAPNLLGAWMNLGNALRELGRSEDAAGSFRKAIALQPNLADAHAALATILGQQGRAPAALESFRAALRIDPNHVNAHINFGLFLRNQNEFDGAIEHLSQAIRLAPQNADAHEHLARALWSTCRLDEAIEHYERAQHIAPTPRRKLLLATLIPPIYSSIDDVQKWRDRLERNVDALHRENFRFDITNDAPPTIVYLPYQGLEDRAIAEKIAQLCTLTPSSSTREANVDDDDSRPFRARETAPASASPFSSAPLVPESEIETETGKITVGFLSSLFKDQTVGLWMQGLIAQLDRGQFDVTVITTANWTDGTGTFIRERADHYVALPRSLSAARQRIRDLNLDALLFADYGMDPWTGALAHSKLARTQCLTWGHPITSGLSTIDYFLSHVHAERTDDESGDAQQNYTEKLVRFEHLPVYYYRPRPPSLPATRGEFDLRADANVYGCLQAQCKLHPAFDEAIVGILRRDPNGVLLLSRTGTARAEHVIEARLRALAPDVIDRVRFIPSLDRDRFRALTNLCDVLLAPFPFGAGDSALEGFALNLPTVTLPTNYLKGRLTYAMYKMMKIDDAIARDVEGYINIAVRLGTDRAANQSIRARIRASSDVLFENPAGVRELERFLRSISRDR